MTYHTQSATRQISPYDVCYALPLALQSPAPLPYTVVALLHSYSSSVCQGPHCRRRPLIGISTAWRALRRTPLYHRLSLVTFLILPMCFINMGSSKNSFVPADLIGALVILHMDAHNWAPQCPSANIYVPC